MPPDTVKVDRTTPWGNPFVIGKHGDRARCVQLFEHMLCGYLCISHGAPLADAQTAFLAHARQHMAELRGKHLACWCPLDKPCHADVLLRAAMRPA